MYELEKYVNYFLRWGPKYVDAGRYHITVDNNNIWSLSVSIENFVIKTYDY